MYPLIKAVRQTLGVEESVQAPQKHKPLFKRIQKENYVFPMFDEFKDLFSEEWNRADKNFANSTRFAKLYPFKLSDVEKLEHPLKVDTVLMRLARHVTLPLEDAAFFRDVLERRIDLDLKRTFSLAGVASRPAMALASVSKALESWVDQLLSSAGNEVGSESTSFPHLIKLAASFMSGASVDLIKSLARVMLSSVTARRVLWLRP